MNVRILSLLALAALAACDAGPKAQAPAVKEVATADQGQYWLLDRDTLPADIPAVNGCFRVRAIIGSDGKVSQPKVLALVGLSLRDWLPGFLAGLRFDPAPGNTGRTPISTVLTWTLTQAVTTQTVYAVSANAAMKAAVADDRPVDTQDWKRECNAEMDRQMGITTAKQP